MKKVGEALLVMELTSRAMVRVSTRVAPEGQPIRELKLHKRELKVPKRVQNWSGKVPPIFLHPPEEF